MEFFKEDGVNIGSKLPGQLMQVHRLGTECSELKERAAALKLVRMRFEKQGGELEAVNQPTVDNLRFEELSNFVSHEGPKMGQSISTSLKDQYTRMRTELHKSKELLKMDKKYSEVEEKTRAAEEEVWIRQAAKCSSGYAESTISRERERQI